MIERSFLRIPLAVALVFVAALANAQERRIVLASDRAVAETGLWSFVLPRFSLKTGVSVELVVIEADQIAGTDAVDVLLLEGTAEAAALAANNAESEWRGVMTANGPMGEYAAVLLHAEAGNKHARRFMDWLVSDIGQRTIASFRRDGAQVFFPWAVEAVVVTETPITGNVRLGEALALRNCGRCHVVSEKNKYGGIDSTPSFPGLRNLTDWRERFDVFWTLNPHPSFTQIKGVTEPFDPGLPPAIAPVYLSVDDVENIGAFFATIKPRDLGPPLQSN